MNPALKKMILEKNYKLILKANDKEMWATQDTNLTDDSYIDIYSLYAYDKLDIEPLKWYKVEDLI